MMGELVETIHHQRISELRKRGDVGAAAAGRVERSTRGWVLGDPPESALTAALSAPLSTRYILGHCRPGRRYRALRQGSSGDGVSGNPSLIPEPSAFPHHK